MDNKAVKILLNTIKSSQKECPKDWWEWENYMKFITTEDFNYAKEQSVMFERETLSHNDIINRIRIAVSKISKEDVVNAFVYSLSTRHLEYRSFLSSYCIALRLPEHDFIACPSPNEETCNVCGLDSYEFEEPIDYNTINYFKYKHGSCSDNIIDILFDLEQFPKYPAVKPTSTDEDILNDLKAQIKSSDLKDRIPQLNKKISKVIKSNNEERQGILEIFGIIGILHDNEHFGYADKYITYSERKNRPVRFDDIGYPASWWQGKFGIDEEKWIYWFK